MCCDAVAATAHATQDYIKSQEKDGWVPLTVIAAFKKMVSYTTDLDVIRTALKASDALDLDEKGDNLRRRFVTPDKDPHKERIVHASGFGVDGGKDAVETNIGKALERFGSVENVRALRNLSQDGRLLDGSAFVRFASGRRRVMPERPKPKLNAPGNSQRPHVWLPPALPLTGAQEEMPMMRALVC